MTVADKRTGCLTSSLYHPIMLKADQFTNQQ